MRICKLKLYKIAPLHITVFVPTYLFPLLYPQHRHLIVLQLLVLYILLLLLQNLIVLLRLLCYLSFLVVPRNTIHIERYFRGDFTVHKQYVEIGRLI